MIHSLMTAFTGATGIACRYLASGRTDPVSTTQGFCERLQLDAAAKQRCCIDMEFAGQQADRTGQPYFSRCHAGLVTVACAVMEGQTPVGTLLCGPILLWEKDELAITEILDNLRGFAGDRHALFEDYFNLPILDVKRLGYLADLLTITADAIGTPDRTAIDAKRDLTLQQMKLAGELIDRKKADESPVDRLTAAGTYPVEKERELLSRIRVGDREGARHCLSTLLAAILYETAGNLNLMRARVLELVVVMSRAAMDGGLQLPQLLGDRYDFLSELEKHHRLEDIFAWVTRLSDTFTDAISVTRNLKSTRYLAGVIDYIHEQYAAPLTLETAASRVPISPNYLSHLFRDELGMTFLEYVTRVRLEKAKELLRTTDLLIRDIASRVGYEDAGYFTRVFRKSVGVSPNHYRTGSVVTV